MPLDELKIPPLGDTSKFAGPLCKQLFGKESVTGHTQSPKPEFVKVIDSLARRGWERYRRHMNSMVKSGLKRKEEFGSALEGEWPSSALASEHVELTFMRQLRLLILRRTGFGDVCAF